jgi:guanosine-3',5'-bis(diphosphate) 3'-pyrophosphohydrolase
MTELSRLDKGILFAIRSHAGQVDRDGTPHIFHSLRVMERVRDAGGDEDLQIAAVLHDVLEDTDVSRTDLVLKFGERVAEAVDGVTRKEGEIYRNFVARAARWRDSRFIKFHDVHDNLERSLAQGDDIAKRYATALHIIDNTKLED